MGDDGPDPVSLVMLLDAPVEPLSEAEYASKLRHLGAEVTASEMPRARMRSMMVVQVPGVLLTMVLNCHDTYVQDREAAAADCTRKDFADMLRKPSGLGGGGLHGR